MTSTLRKMLYERFPCQARAVSFKKVMVALLLVLFGSSAQSQQRWFGPQEPFRTVRGVVDWQHLFEKGAAWPIDQVAVFEFGTGHIDDSPDEVLEGQAEFLRENGVSIALQIQSVAKTPLCGGPGEGFDTVEEHRKIARKLKRLGIEVRYLIMDEPLWFAKFDRDPGGCQYPLDELVHQVTLSVNEYIELFPNIAIGDIEPVPALTGLPNWKEAYKQWAAALEKSIGRPVSSLRFDVNWSKPSAAVGTADAIGFARLNGILSGVIYNSGGPDDGDASWVNHAKHNIIDLEGRLRVSPDIAAFESWEVYPSHAMPYTADTALSSLIRFYSLQKTKIIVENPNDRQIAGRAVLDSEIGSPIPFAHVEEKVFGVDPSTPPPVKVLSGIVPSPAKSAILGLRINMECNNCSGKNDFLIGSLDYQEGSGDIVKKRVNLSSEPRKIAAASLDGVEIRLAPQLGPSVVRIKTAPFGKYFFNTNSFRVTPGATYRLNVPIGSIAPDGISGYVTIVWLDEDGRGMSRTILQVPPDVSVQASTTTDASGRFSFPRLPEDCASARRVQIYLSWSDTRRGAIADLPPYRIARCRAH